MMKNKQEDKRMRNQLRNGLLLCTEAEVHIFRRMYFGQGSEHSIDEMVGSIEIDKIDWALKQVENTLRNRGANTESVTSVTMSRGLFNKILGVLSALDNKNTSAVSQVDSFKEKDLAEIGRLMKEEGLL